MPAGSIAAIFEESCGFDAIFCAIGLSGVGVFEPVVEPGVVEVEPFDDVEPLVNPFAVDPDPLVVDDVEPFVVEVFDPVEFVVVDVVPVPVVGLVVVDDDLCGLPCVLVVVVVVVEWP
jgi:hypothetical protein